MRLAAFAALGLLAAAARADHPTGGILGGVAGPINAVPAGTLPAGMWAFALRYDTVNFRSLSNAELAALDAAGEDVHTMDSENTQSLAASYGVTDAFTLGATVPYVSMHNIVSSGSPPDPHGDSSGLGDLTLYGAWLLADSMSDDNAARTQFSLLAGLQLPTGEDHEHAGSELFETEHQPGKGTISPEVGLTVTRSWGRSALTADVIYKLATQGDQRTDMGDVVRGDLAWTWRLTEAELKREMIHADGSRHVHGTADAQWDLSLELNGFWKDKVEVSDVSDDNSGGAVVLFSPGVRVTFPQNYSFFANVGVPVVENVNGEEHETDTHAVVGVSWAF